MSTIFEDAERYLTLRTSGWTNPEVDPHEMIRELVDAEGATLEDMVTQDSYDELEVEKSTLEARVEELEDEDYLMRNASVESLMIALEKAISREKNNAVINAKEHLRIDHEAQVIGLSTEILRLRAELGVQGAIKDPEAHAQAAH
jgi:hypothetical protein